MAPLVGATAGQSSWRVLPAAASSTAEPNPPARLWSSTVMICVPSITRATISSSTGLAKRAFITVTSMFLSASCSAAASASANTLPKATIAMLSRPCFTVTLLPNWKGFSDVACSICPFGTTSLGYRMATGPACDSANVRASLISNSPAGETSTMLGSIRIKPMSISPWWVGPSLPTRPLRSTQKITGRFCSATS